MTSQTENDTAVIEVPEWMQSKYDYVVRWDPVNECWSIVPF